MGGRVSVANCCAGREKEFHAVSSQEIPSHPTTSRPRCQFGDGCRRGNPSHFVEVSHPGDPDFEGGSSSVPVVQPGPVLKVRQKGFEWIRTANEKEDRDQRAFTATLTLQACRGHGYQLRNDVIPLKRIDAMLQGTKVFTLEEVSQQLQRSRSLFSSAAPPRIVVSGAPTALDAAAAAATTGDSVVVVSAASAYHPCGGFRTGGRHALEESMCIQSTLCASLQRALFLSRYGHVKVTPPARLMQEGRLYLCFFRKDKYSKEDVQKFKAIVEDLIARQSQCNPRNLRDFMLAEQGADFSNWMNRFLADKRKQGVNKCNSSTFRWPIAVFKGIPQALCAVDICGAVAYMSEVVTFINLIVVHCQDFLDVNALCAGSIAAITTGAAAIAPYGAAVHAGCANNKFLKNKKSQDLLDALWTPPEFDPLKGEFPIPTTTLAPAPAPVPRRLQQKPTAKQLEESLAQIAATRASLEELKKATSVPEAGNTEADMETLLNLMGAEEDKPRAAWPFDC